MNWILTALLSLASGSVGSIVFAQAAGRLGEIAKTRYTTTTTLQGILRTYRHELDYQYSRLLSENRGFPAEFADIPGQEKLTVAVLRALPDLRRSTAAKLRTELTELVGPNNVALGESRMYVPDAVLQPNMETGRQGLLMRRIHAERDRYSDGVLPRLLSQQNEQDHDDYYKRAQAALDRMADLVKP